MACTTILVGKDASYDGSTIIARNEDSANGEFNPKRFIVVKPEEQPREYKSVISHLTITLPDDPLQYTAVPNADLKEGIWGEAGVNEANVAMSATETLTTNERVLGADPFVEYTPAKGDEPEVPGGIGEEDFLTIVLPYVKTAREGVQRLGALLEIRHLRDERRRLLRLQRNLVAGNCGRPSLDCQARAGRGLRDHAEPARYRRIRP